MQAINTTSDWLNKSNEFLYWIPRQREEGRDVYNRICLFYFVLNQPTVRSLQDPIEPSANQMRDSWFTEWLHTYADELGKYHHDPASIAEIQIFKDYKPYNMKDTSRLETLQPLRSMDGAKHQFDAPDTPGYQLTQNRGLIVMDSPIGLVAMLPMGMAKVSSVVLTAGEGVVLTKVDEISYF
ncbi:MAG: hypothetical protein Q9166_002698 [cf. Caloplaca sp. 2 TL-2023]